MLISNEDAIKRLNSPLNLMNRLTPVNSRSKAMSLFVPSVREVKEVETKIVPFNPFESKSQESLIPAPAIIPPAVSEKIENLIDNHDTQIKLALAHDKALDVLTNSIEMISTKLDDMKPEKLAGVITATSKVVESIRKERAEASKLGKDREVHYHFYTPSQKKISDYAVIDVTA